MNNNGKNKIISESNKKKFHLTITANICAVRFSGVSLGSRPAVEPFDAPCVVEAPSKS